MHPPQSGKTQRYLVIRFRQIFVTPRHFHRTSVQDLFGYTLDKGLNCLWNKNISKFCKSTNGRWKPTSVNTRSVRRNFFVTQKLKSPGYACNSAIFVPIQISLPPSNWAIKETHTSMRTSREWTNANSASTIWNSVRWFLLLLLSARKTRPNVYTLGNALQNK